MPTLIVNNEQSPTYLVPTLRKAIKQDPNAIIKNGIWIYFILLIFEGGLRKWLLPGLATPLLIVRDPVAIWLIYITWRRGLLKPNIYLVGMIIIGIVSLFTALLLGHGNVLVALFGARILLFHFPLIFVIGKIFTREDLIRIGKVTLWISIPMSVLLALQFYSPQSAWVNRGVGGDMAGAGYIGALGYSRPPGTFSFTTGTTMYYSFLAPFIFYFWLYPKNMNRIILIASTLGLLAAIPLSISRGLLFQVGVTALFTLIATFRKPEYLGKLVVAIIGIILTFLVLSQTSTFSTATDVFTSRFTDASGTEGGLKGTLVDRYLGGLLGSITSSADEKPYFGYGIGMGTNVGSQLLTGGRTFLIAEGEWGRMVGELGPLMGLAVIFIRLGLCVKLIKGSYNKLVLGDLLPWLLLSYGLLDVAQGGWAQPTSLGFCVVIGGLLLASIKERPVKSIKKPLKISGVNN